MTIREFHCSNCGGPLGHYPVGAEAGQDFECEKCIRQGNTPTEEQKRDEKKSEAIDALEGRWYEEDLQEEAQPDISPKESPQEIVEPQLAGSSLPRTLTRPRVSPKKKAKFEKEIRETTERRERGEYDPIEDEQDKEVHFQYTVSDSKLRNALKPEGTSHIGGQNSKIARVAQDMGEKKKNWGIIKRETGWRSDIPWWVETDEGIESFFVERERISGKQRDPKGDGLDKLVLIAYYREGYEDRRIFIAYEEIFKAAKDGGHWPRGVHKIENGEQLIKKRRQRLVQRGKILLGARTASPARVILIRYTSEAGPDRYGCMLSRQNAQIAASDFLDTFRIEAAAPDAEIVADERFATSEAARAWAKAQALDEMLPDQKPRAGKIINAAVS